MPRNNHCGNTVSVVWKLAEPIAESLGLDIWDIRFLKEGGQWYLRVYIDNPQGISIEDCEAMSRALDKPLDDLDPIDKAYCLEVSSPGVERELTRDEHFNRFMGSKVIVKTIRPMENGDREFHGILKSFDNDSISITLDNEIININRKDTVFIKLDDFEN